MLAGQKTKFLASREDNTNPTKHIPKLEPTEPDIRCPSTESHHQTSYT